MGWWLVSGESWGQLPATPAFNPYLCPPVKALFLKQSCQQHECQGGFRYLGESASTDVVIPQLVVVVQRILVPALEQPSGLLKQSCFNTVLFSKTVWHRRALSPSLLQIPYIKTVLPQPTAAGLFYDRLFLRVTRAGSQHGHTVAERTALNRRVRPAERRCSNT